MTPIDNADALAERYDLLVVGAGPAGLSAAARGAELGLDVLLVDENPAPGGQIYRSVGTTPVQNRAILGADYWKGAHIVARFERSGASYASLCSVWSLGPSKLASADHELGLSLNGKARIIGARQIILATGAQERPFPVPGWTLPGVMTAGAAQIALKSAGIVPAGRTVLAGCGPLLYLLANQLAIAGCEIVAVLDTTPRANWHRAIPMLPDFLRSPYLAKGLKLMIAARRNLRFVAGVTKVSASGERMLQHIVYERGSRSEAISCDTLLLHHGVIPSVNLSNAAGCVQEFDEGQHAWVPRVDSWFASSVAGIAIAGDGAGIGGAESAALRGEIAALGAASRLGKLQNSDRDRQATPIRAELRKRLRGRRFLDLLYKPAPQFLAPTQDDTIICRCEEVTAGEVRDVTRRFGVTGPNQLKAFLRCGMGPCQSRNCGPTVVELIAETCGITPAEAGSFRQRAPVKPVTLAELATLPRGELDAGAVIE